LTPLVRPFAVGSTALTIDATIYALDDCRLRLRHLLLIVVASDRLVIAIIVAVVGDVLLLLLVVGSGRLRC
jgi:hypothetical protein